MIKLFGICLDGVGLYILDVSALSGDFQYTTEPEGFPDIQDRFFAEDRFPIIIGLAGIFSHVCAITLLLWQSRNETDWDFGRRKCSRNTSCPESKPGRMPTV